MSVGIDSVDQLDGIAIVRLHARPDPCELADVVACRRSLQADPAVRAVAVVSVSENFSAAVLTDAGDPMTIAPKSSGLLKPFGVGLRGSLPEAEINRLALLGPSNAMTALRAAELGLVDEIVDLDALEGALVRRLVRFSGG